MNELTTVVKCPLLETSVTRTPLYYRQFTWTWRDSNWYKIQNLPQQCEYLHNTYLIADSLLCPREETEIRRYGHIGDFAPWSLLCFRLCSYESDKIVKGSKLNNDARLFLSMCTVNTLLPTQLWRLFLFYFTLFYFVLFCFVLFCFYRRFTWFPNHKHSQTVCL